MSMAYLTAEDMDTQVARVLANVRYAEILSAIHSSRRKGIDLMSL